MKEQVVSIAQVARDRGVARTAAERDAAGELVPQATTVSARTDPEEEVRHLRRESEMLR